LGSATGLFDGDDRSDAARLAGVVDKPGVIAFVERRGRRSDPARSEGVEQRFDRKGFVLTGGLYFPREWQARDGADGNVNSEAVEAASAPRRNSGTMAQEASGSLNRSRSRPPLLRNRWPFPVCGHVAGVRHGARHARESVNGSSRECDFAW
jgi:hypothetical protein